MDYRYNDCLRYWTACIGLVHAMIVKIMGIDYPIRQIHPNISMDTANLGECDNAACEIRLNSQQSPGLIRSTALHEIIEALEFRLEIGLTHQQINLLEAGIFGTFTDSPQVARWIFGS